MPAESILDRLDREHGDARQYIATLIVVGGATRAQIADALARKYHIPAPTGRSITGWRARDEKLRGLIDQMEAAKRDLAPGDDPTALLPPEVNRAQVASDLFGVCIQSPSFAKLLHREGQRRPAGDVGLAFDPDAPIHLGEDADPDDDVLAVLEAGHETAADFEADCAARLGDYEPIPAATV